MAPQAAQLQLLDLSADLLYRIFCQLPFTERLQLSHVSRKCRQLCAAPSELWRRVDAQPAAVEGLLGANEDAFNPVQQALAGVSQFADWLAPRAPAVEELRFQFRPAALPPVPVPLPHMLLPVLRCEALPLLRLLSIDWGSAATFTIYGAAGGPALPALASLEFYGGTHLMVPPTESQAAATAALPRLEAFGLFDSLLSGSFHSPWLPPTLTKLCLSNCGLEGLPGVLAHLPRLRSLTADRNGSLGAASFSVLTHLSRLEDLNLSENYLSTFPHQVSVLTNLRILYLHRCFAAESALRPACWAALRPLTRLAFLSISGNKLAELPAVVGEMTQLQALHLEENEFRDLSVAPVCANLRELLLDWKNAMLSPHTLSACTQLSRLILCDHCVTVAAPPQHTVRVPPAAAAADALADALSSMPALRLVQDVLPPQEYLIVTAPVARAMWLLPRRCPHLRVELLEGTYVGWTLADLERHEQPAGHVDDTDSWP